MKLQPSPEQSAEFYKHLQADLEKQREVEEYFMESMMNLSGVPQDLFADDDMNLLSEPLLQSDEMSPEEFEETNEVPLTEEELFHIIREQEISEHENVQY